MRRWIVLLLIAMLPWHHLAWATSAHAGDDGSAAGHAFAHWSGEAHHHHDAGHDDGDHDDDDGMESILHMVQTSAHFHAPAVLPPVIDCSVLPPDQPVPEGISLREHCGPFLEGLRRPPRSAC